MSEIKLKPCPFCGMRPEMCKVYDKHIVQCVNPECPAVAYTQPFGTEKGTAEAWNNLKGSVKVVARVEVDEEKLRAAVYEGVKRALGVDSAALSGCREMKEILSVATDMARGNERLEKENAELKGELEILQCIQQPTGNMELPLDADGVPIRIGDEMDVDGDVMTVIGYRRSFGGMLLITKDKSTGHIFVPDPSKVRRLKPEPADSWEKLEEDASKIACEYADAPLDENGMTTCDGCRFRKHEECYQGMMFDVLKRAKKLAGIGEEAE